ncbi:hypothetical protein [Tepidimonas fonticaldi]|uniref:hypothetical protein n=1 Tax=Tepidimonas fonticaldi TaxID=1101373 RepID=UPI00163DE219|nr:hypothetical protein [Tepidimonas fonticaldi]
MRVETEDVSTRSSLVRPVFSSDNPEPGVRSRAAPAVLGRKSNAMIPDAMVETIATIRTL